MVWEGRLIIRGAFSKNVPRFSSRGVDTPHAEAKQQSQEDSGRRRFGIREDDGHICDQGTANTSCDDLSISCQ